MMLRPNACVLALASTLLLVHCGSGTTHTKEPQVPTTAQDSDGDTIIDSEDDCVEEAEDVDEWQDEDGCPDPDNDGDGVPDEDDKCPFSLEVQDDCPVKDGCPGSHCHPCLPGE